MRVEHTKPVKISWRARWLPRLITATLLILLVMFSAIILLYAATPQPGNIFINPVKSLK